MTRGDAARPAAWPEFGSTAAARRRDAIDAHGAGRAVRTQRDVVGLAAVLAGAFPAQVDALVRMECARPELFSCGEERGGYPAELSPCSASVLCHARRLG